jgi:hypothetical protein
MTRLARSAPLLVTVVVLAALWVTNAGAVAFMSGGPGGDPSRARSLNKSQLPPTNGSSRPRRGDQDAGLVPFLVIGYILLGALVLALLAFVVSATLSNRRDPRERLKEADPSLDATAASIVPPVLLESTEQQLRAIREGSPRNAIVACWWELERSSEATGLPRAVAETSSEFTGRVLSRYRVRGPTIEGLAALYREARFSVHEMTEVDRDRAAAALEQILADLRTARSDTSPSVTGS